MRRLTRIAFARSRRYAAMIHPASSWRTRWQQSSGSWAPFSGRRFLSWSCRSLSSWEFRSFSSVKQRPPSRCMCFADVNRVMSTSFARPNAGGTTSSRITSFRLCPVVWQEARRNDEYPRIFAYLARSRVFGVPKPYLVRITARNPIYKSLNPAFRHLKARPRKSRETRQACAELIEQTLNELQ